MDRDDGLLYQYEVNLVAALAGGTIFIEYFDQGFLSVKIGPGEAISLPNVNEPILRKIDEWCEHQSSWHSGSACDLSSIYSIFDIMKAIEHERKGRYRLYRCWDPHLRPSPQPLPLGHCALSFSKFK
ncbi:hypothetical protein B0H65DRAFT_546105 [Neurospora tetraspora]|uniref:Uncharacterized protein n=1 Tax=Neurospora tetraspora TaxID=94610 RepID=A0AAE0MU25_9PEZI|nr:hypothetical protein B0H65DRAFT_546105 [Neurospora tetraspora]